MWDYDIGEILVHILHFQVTDMNYENDNQQRGMFSWKESGAEERATYLLICTGALQDVWRTITVAFRAAWRTAGCA